MFLSKKKATKRKPLLGESVSELDFDNVKILKKELVQGTYEKGSIHNCWLENSLFREVTFIRTDFSHTSDHGNVFDTVNFKNCKLNRAAIGYDGSKYMNCVFENCNFTGAIFIRGEFDDCKFVNCKLKGVDFGASSFMNCSFEGKVMDVWFRGGYAASYGEKEFGKARANTMLNVSFEEAELEYPTFSNNCDLSTIRLPKKGNYHLFDKWPERLTFLKGEIESWPEMEKKDAMDFIEAHMVHAKTQPWYAIGGRELEEDYKNLIWPKLIDGLKRFIK
ncbi:pentapeptide repeat-containing protein [Maribacter sp. 2-571]|uniref:pentapeptide repeat-containing protein n=1 Tax=Maribacter sp. 2-571 TaxID=3417569 RepID=UPI003D3508A7